MTFTAMDALIIEKNHQQSSLSLLFGKVLPVLHGHIRFLQTGIFPVGNGDGFKKSLPEGLYPHFLF